MTKQEKIFRDAAKKAGVDIRESGLTAADLARVVGCNPSTTQRAVLDGHIPARRRVPRGRMMIAVDDAVRYFHGQSAAT